MGKLCKEMLEIVDNRWVGLSFFNWVRNGKNKGKKTPNWYDING